MAIKRFETDLWWHEDGRLYVRTEAIYFERTGIEQHRRAARNRLQRALIPTGATTVAFEEWDRDLDYATDELVTVVWRTVEPVSGSGEAAA